MRQDYKPSGTAADTAAVKRTIGKIIESPDTDPTKHKKATKSKDLMDFMSDDELKPNPTKGTHSF